MRRSLAVSRRLMPSPSITTTLHRGFPCSYASGEATVQMTSTSGVCVSVSACLSMSRFPCHGARDFGDPLPLFEMENITNQPLYGLPRL